MLDAMRPIRTMLCLGLICAFLFVPLQVMLGCYFSGTSTVCLTLWGCAAVYGFILARWSGKNQIQILLPLLVLLCAVPAVISALVFVLLACVILSWIRSGICFTQSPGRKLLAEMCISPGGGLLIAGLTPTSVLTWAMGVWLFFLVQAIYFAIFEKSLAVEKKMEPDPFELARLQAEKILSSRAYR